MSMIWMSPLSIEACRSFSMSWTSSSALNAGFFQQVFDKITDYSCIKWVFRRKCFKNFFTACDITGSFLIQGWNKLVLYQISCMTSDQISGMISQWHISGMISGVISYTIWTYAVELDGTWEYWSSKSRRSSVPISWSLQSLSKSVRLLCRLGEAPEWTTTAHQYWYHS